MRYFIFLLVSVMMLITIISSQAIERGLADGKAVCIRHSAHRMMERGLNLTPEQRAQAKNIFMDARQKVKAVLTPEQQQMLNDRVKNFRFGRNLSAEQRAQIEPIIKDARAKAKTIKENTALKDQEKQAQLAELRSSTRQSIRQIIAPDQQTKPQKDARFAGRKAKLNLSTDQQAKMKAIREDAYAKFRAILTPDQQAKLDQHIQGRHAKSVK